MSSDTQDDTEHLPFSALRSRFEQLAQDRSAPPSPIRVSTPTTGTDETPKAGLSRLRTLSVANDNAPNNSSQSSLHLRSASSSSDLKGSSGRRPPPPPPPRSPKPFLSPPDSEVRESIVESPQTVTKSNLISRVPPPPPAIKPDANSESNGLPVGGVASLRNKFG